MSQQQTTPRWVGIIIAIMTGLAFVGGGVAWWFTRWNPDETIQGHPVKWDKGTERPWSVGVIRPRGPRFASSS